MEISRKIIQLYEPCLIDKNTKEIIIYRTIIKIVNNDHKNGNSNQMVYNLLLLIGLLIDIEKNYNNTGIPLKKLREHQKDKLINILICESKK